MCPVFSFVQQRKSYPIYSWEMVVYVIIISTTFFIMMVLMTVSIKLLPASISGILLYIAIISSYLFDYLFLHTPIGWMELLGAGIIVVTNVGIGVAVACGWTGK